MNWRSSRSFSTAAKSTPVSTAPSALVAGKTGVARRLRSIPASSSPRNYFRDSRLLRAASGCLRPSTSPSAQKRKHWRGRVWIPLQVKASWAHCSSSFPSRSRTQTTRATLKRADIPCGKHREGQRGSPKNFRRGKLPSRRQSRRQRA